MKSTLKHKRGITLVALIVTIVIMLILVSVAMLTGIDSKIINKSEKTVKQFNDDMLDEKIKLNAVVDRIDSLDDSPIKRIRKNEGMIGKTLNINKSGKTKLSINGENYPVNAIVINKSIKLDGTTPIEGATLENNEYSFGSVDDCATKDQEAKNTVLLIVNGDLTIDEGITLTANKSPDGYGGPKGMIIQCTGKLINKGTISMTARGAKATGQNVYLWKNANGEYETVPKEGGVGGGISSDSYKYVGGQPGENGKDRKTGGGSSGALWTSSGRYGQSGAGGAGTSYSGGTGGGGADCGEGYTGAEGKPGNPNGGAGGDGYGNATSGGAGNPGGSSKGNINGARGENGTGGLLVIFANDLDNKGKIEANGKRGGRYNGGGASGGGSINVFVNDKYESTGTFEAEGGKSNGIAGRGSISVGKIENGNYVSLYNNYEENNKA